MVCYLKILAYLTYLTLISLHDKENKNYRYMLGIVYSGRYLKVQIRGRALSCPSHTHSVDVSRLARVQSEYSLLSTVFWQDHFSTGPEFYKVKNYFAAGRTFWSRAWTHISSLNSWFSKNTSTFWQKSSSWNSVGRHTVHSTTTCMYTTCTCITLYTLQLL